MNSTCDGREPLEELAEEFVSRLRAGERPRIADYTRAYPDLAEQIERLFPTLLFMEEAGSRVGRPAEKTVPAGLTRLGEYRIVREVGRGGMGVVFEAVQESLGRRVALKVLPPPLCRDKYLERFQREARAAARLHHTNIVPVFGVGQDAGMHYYVMQFIDGRGLDRVLQEIRRHRLGTLSGLGADAPGASELSSLAQGLLSVETVSTLSPPQGAVARPAAVETSAGFVESHRGNPYFTTVARLGQQVADALHHAHSQGILHRDVKPSNLLLDAAGAVWVADFGLAKAEDSEDLTETGDLVGTLRYMAPERLQGRCDVRSDVYGLGVTLYELLALRPALDAPGWQTLLEQVASGIAPPLRQTVADLPRDLEIVVGKAMARDPADRYASAQDLADDLDRFLSDRPIKARRLNVLERLGRWGRRNPTVAALASTVAALLILGAVGGWWAAVRLSRQVEAVTHAEKDTREQLWQARLAQARAGRASRLPGQRYKSLEALADAARLHATRELRNEAIACLALTDVRIDREWTADLETDRLLYSTGVAFDPMLEHHAYTGADGGIHICTTADGRRVALLPGSGAPVDFLRFSPDGRYLIALCCSGTRPCRVWNWRDRTVVYERPQTGSPVLSVDFRADSESLVVGTDASVEVVALASGKVLGQTHVDVPVGWVAASPERADLAAVCSTAGGSLRVIDVERRRMAARWDGLPAELIAVAWQPQGNRLAASCRDGNIYTFDLHGSGHPGMVGSAALDSADAPAAGAADRPSGHAPGVLRGHMLEARELAFSPDGSLLVSRGWDGMTRFWDLVSERELLRVRGVSFLQFRKDGRRLAYRGYNSRTLGIWELPDRSIGRVLQGPRAEIALTYAGVSFSPDSRLLATSAGPAVCLWDPRSGRLVGTLNVRSTTDLLFDPGGRYLYLAGPSGALVAVLERTEDAGDVLWRAGKPRPLGWPLKRYDGFSFETDRQGERLAVVERFARVVVLPRPGLPGRPLVVRNHPQVSSAALSPDGRYLATGTWRGTGVKVSEVATGRLVADLPTRESAGVAFTRDGAQLLILEPDGSCRAHAVGTWEQQWQRREPDTGFGRSLRAALHPDGRIMAHVRDRENLRLVDLATGEELAVLAVPESQTLSSYQFSPDGRYLAAVTSRGAVQLWDLARLRARLRDLGLDWDHLPLGDSEESAANRSVQFNAER